MNGIVVLDFVFFYLCYTPCVDLDTSVNDFMWSAINGPMNARDL